MNKSKEKEDKHAEFVKRLASLIIGEMTDAKLSFDDLAKKLNYTVTELINIIYSKDKDITVYQMVKIVEAIGCDVVFRDNPISKKRPGGHLRAVIDSDPYDSAG